MGLRLDVGTAEILSKFVQNRIAADFPPPTVRETMPSHDDRVKCILAKHHAHPMPFDVYFEEFQLTIAPGVFCPTYAPASSVIAPFVRSRVRGSVLDVGTGSGILALIASSAATEVTAVDISPLAVDCCRFNVARQGLADKIRVLQGDSFEPLSASKKFDTIILNPPFMHGEPHSWLEYAVYDPNRRLIEGFTCGVAHYLEDQGEALVVFGTEEGIPFLLSLAQRHGLYVETLRQVELDIPFCVLSLRKP